MEILWLTIRVGTQSALPIMKLSTATGLPFLTVIEPPANGERRLQSKHVEVIAGDQFRIRKVLAGCAIARLSQLVGSCH